MARWNRQWLDTWIAENGDVLFDLIRIYLGIGLFVKGIQFTWDDGYISNLLLQSGRLQVLSTAIAHYIPIAHIGGGLLLAMGFMTRTAVLFQLPILAGAVFLIHMQEGLFTRGQNLEFTALVLFLLLLILVHGPGRLSVDHYLVAGRTPEEELDDEGEEETAYADDRTRQPIR
ncbi:MAG TPA: DoxX family protein [Candidatus Polarisedimenticolaceae bacterium]|nr:DoxX family protein [Candidatus Polarisedimenticolaceae bacterium]